ncbi:ABC transporter ATP-binding protein [Cryobacterium sp. PH31-L1]|uniref:ABC transporter ATP-binding protein n=1 Tax=Cryobacterium sp. PH31-L1 TaxID=3046199 RepID=UPI0024B99C24|nr:ABC transporter ATP-binding protein [Cryobacterium sp. PH31-L1]MDJ0378806.1 ABC transporter ATP-binding protein [Cryobacterium sp. PH31-L1]
MSATTIFGSDGIVPSGIAVTGVSRAFGSVFALLDATLTVPAGSVTALIGPNGSGKTTLLLMLATLLTPDAGSIRINGHDPVTEPERVRALMGWMPDTLGSWPSLSARAALQTTGRMYRMTREQAAARADALILLTDLTDFADRPSRVLSRGQKQRLSLARALVHSPSVLLLDEPASGLDPAARAALRQLLRRLASEGAAILVSSHVLAELDEMADAAVYLSDGRTASPEQVAAAGASARAWRIRSLDDAALAGALAAPGVVGALVQVLGVDQLGTLVQVENEASAAALLHNLVLSGVPVCDFGPAVGNLEHTFLDLTRERPARHSSIVVNPEVTP